MTGPPLFGDSRSSTIPGIDMDVSGGSPGQWREGRRGGREEEEREERRRREGGRGTGEGIMIRVRMKGFTQLCM